MIKARIRQLAMMPLRIALNAAGRVYVPGHKIGDALAVAHGKAVTLGYFHSPTDTPEKIARISQSIVDALSNWQPKSYISLKAPALNYDEKLIDDVASLANQYEMLVHFDSHEHHTAPPTLTCFRRAVELGGNVGLTIPGRWKRSLDDADEASALGARIRVVKGEWCDPGAPDIDPRQGFLNVIDRLAGNSGRIAVATHDPWLAKESLLRLKDGGTACEIELLNGLPEIEILKLAEEFSVPVRFYIPFGIAWRPYALSKALKNPHIIWWVTTDAVRGLITRFTK